MHKFLAFLKSVKTETNTSLIESIKKGFFACFENFDIPSETNSIIRVIRSDEGFMAVIYDTGLKEVEDSHGPYPDVYMAVQDAKAWSEDTNIPFVMRSKEQIKIPTRQLV